MNALLREPDTALTKRLRDDVTSRIASRLLNIYDDMTVLLVEHSERLATLVTRNLERAGFGVDLAQTAAAASAACAATKFELVLFDLDVPDVRGLSWLKAMRERHDMTPVILLAAEDGLRAEAMKFGVDDCLIKPVAPEELVARARAVRRSADGLEAALCLGNLIVDTAMRQVIVDDRARNFSVSEVTLLGHLIRHRRRIVRKESLGEAMYGSRDAVNAIEAHMYRLRRRLREVGAKVRIQTVRRIGYIIEEAE
jgi:two-component system response regulator TctD